MEISFRRNIIRMFINNRLKEVMNMLSLEEIAKVLNAEILDIGKPVKTVQQAAQATGFSPNKIIKSLVLVCDKGPLLTILDGDSRIDFKKLEPKFGRCRFAKPYEVREITGYEVGGVPPVGISLLTIIDLRVMRKDYVIGGGGSIDRLIKIAPQKIAEYQNAEIMEIRE